MADFSRTPDPPFSRYRRYGAGRRPFVVGAVAGLLMLLSTGPPTPDVIAAGNDILKTEVYRLYETYKADLPDVRDMTPQRAMGLLSIGRIQFVDTRRSAETAVSMLPGAVTEAEFVDHIDAYRDKTIVAYCTIGYRSGRFAREMSRDGLTVFNLRGGILAWVLEGGRIYDWRGESKRIHVYGPQWNYPAEGYEAVMFSVWRRLF